MSGRRGRETFLYWFLVATLLAFGFIGYADGYGVPSLIVGFTLASLAGVRHRPFTFWPRLVGVAVFTGVYALSGPLGWCTGVVSVNGAPVFRSICRRLLLSDEVRSVGLAFWPALVVSVAAGLLAFRVTRRRMLHNHDRSSPAGGA